MTDPRGIPVLAAPPAEPPLSWAAAELATLAAVAETFVRGGSVRRANLAAAALELTADPSQVRQLRLVLRALDSRAFNLLSRRRGTRFSDLSHADRERVLWSWGTSRVPQQRAAYQAFKKLLTFLALADPGPTGSNPWWEVIGYRPDAPERVGDGSPIRLFEPPADPGGETAVIDADVVVVGSGAGGGVLAAALTAAGRSVVVLEAGEAFTEATMPRGELEGFERMFLGHGSTTTWDGSTLLLAGSCLGGGTTVNWMTSLPPPASVRREWTRDHGVDGWDGPEADADIAAIHAELGVTAATSCPPKDQVVLRGAAALGWGASAIPRNGDGCTDCGTCTFGCVRGTKQSGLRVHLADASAAGARIVADARVSRVLLEHGRAIGVEAVIGGAAHRRASSAVAAGGLAAHPPNRPRRLTVRAPQVVVAAGALCTPIVLLRSGIDHPAVGRNLRIHPVPGMGARFAERIDMWSGVMQGARVHEFAEDAPDHRGYVIEGAPGHPGLIALAFPWAGTDHFADLMSQVGWYSPLLAVTRDGGAGTVRLTRSGRTRIDYALDASGRGTLRHALGSMARIARAAGASHILTVGTPTIAFGDDGLDDRAFDRYLTRLAACDFAPNRGGILSAHQMGTARMGADPRAHACDPAGRVRAGPDGTSIRGLYVADTSLFPTGIGVNPMVTVMALARRVARTVLAEG